MRMPSRLSGKLLVAILPVVVAAVVGLVTLQYSLARRAMLSAIDQQIRFIAEKKAGEIDGFFDQCYRDLFTLAETPLIADYYRNVDYQLNDEAEAYRKELLRLMTNFAARGRVYARILYLDAGGRVVCRVGGAASEPAGFTAADFAAARDARDGWWVSPLESLAGTAGVVYYAKPVRDESGALKGMVVLAYDLAQVVDQLRSVPLGLSGSAFVETPAGRLVARAGPSKAEGLLVESHPLARRPWTVVLQVPLEDFLGPLRSIRDAALLISLLGLAGLVAALLVLVRSLTRPIEALVAASRAIGSGDLSHRIREVGTDELGALSGAFNEMAESLDENRRETARLQSQLIQAEKLSAVGSLISAVAHELNNPLAAISGYAQMALLEELPPRLRDDLSHLYANVLRSRKVVENLLFFVRQSRQERRKVDLNSAVRAALELLEYRLLKTEGVRVETDLAESGPEIAGDFQQIVQVLVNLIANACDAMEGVVRYPAGKRLRIRTGARDGRGWIEIEDNGTGIDPALRDEIFRPFFTTKPEGRGTGLGLPICRQIVRAHGGEISVSGEAGRGSVFRVEMPLGNPAEFELIDEAAPAREIPAVPGKRVLVADDEKDIAEVVARLLREDGDEVFVAHHGAAALALLDQRRYDLVVTDIEMEHAKGTDLYAALVERGALPRTRVLFITGDILNPKVLDFLSRTESEYLVKPFDVRDLRQAMRRLLSAQS